MYNMKKSTEKENKIDTYRYVKEEWKNINSFVGLVQEKKRYFPSMNSK